MWIKRDFELILREAAALRPALVLTGARQTGKTSLLQRTFPDHQYVSLDIPSEADQAERDAETFLRRHPAPLLIDEVQKAPGLFRNLKLEIDRHRVHKGRFILTGSQKFELMKGVADSLAGRIEVLELEPLSLGEIRAAFPAMTLHEIILRGGYPELYEERSLKPFRFYGSYMATYLERDVRSLLQIAQLRDFERFLRACALRSGQMLNKAELARDVGISPSTANEWLSVLATSNQVTLLEPWFSNRTKSLTKTPKLYLRDTGLLLFLLGIETEADLLKSPLLGAIWETFVFAELRKRQLRDSGHWSLFYWRDRTREVDFLVHKGGRFELFESKWAERPGERDADNLEHLTEILQRDRVNARKILCRTPNAFRLPNGVEVEPL